MNLRQTLAALFGPRADAAPAVLERAQTEPEASGEDRPTVARLRRELAEHPSQGLTPTALYALLREAEQGDLRRQHELAADMEEKDPQIQSDLGKRRLAATALDWDVAPPPDATAPERAAAEQAKAVLAGLEPWGDSADSGMEDLLIQMGDGILHGWVNLALPWGRDGTQRIVRQPEWTPHAWFQTRPEHPNRLTLRDGTPAGEALWPLGWVQHRHRAKSGYVARMGLLRVLAWPYLFQNYALGDLAELLEILGIPVRLGKYPAQTATAAEKSALLRAVTQLGHTAAGIVPDSMAIELLQAAQGSEKPFESMLQWAERSKSKAILGGTLTTGTDAGSGAYALGQVHERGLADLVTSDVRQYAASIRTAMLLPMAALNYGVASLARAPKLVFDTGDAADLKALADSLPKLVAVGLRIPERWARETARIPEPQGNEPVLAVQAAAPAPAQAQTEPSPAMQAALAALTAAQPRPARGAPVPEVDTRVLDRLTAQAQPAVRAMIEQIRAMLAKAETMQEALEMLEAAYPTIDAGPLAEALTQAGLVAELAGRADVLDEAAE